jgi:hypothetical protein
MTVLMLCETQEDVHTWSLIFKSRWLVQLKEMSGSKCDDTAVPETSVDNAMNRNNFKRKTRLSIWASSTKSFSAVG